MPRRTLLSLLALIPAWACSPAPPAPERPRAPVERAAAAAHEAEPRTLLAAVPTGTVGPFLVNTANGLLSLWAEPDPRAPALEWASRPVSLAGRPSGPTRRLGAAPPGLRLVRLRSTPDGALALAASEHDGLHRLHSLVLRPDGSLNNAPHQLAAEGNQTLWLDAVPTPSGALVLWAEHQGTHAALYALAIDAEGKARGGLTRLDSAAVAWQAVAASAGALLAVTGRDGVIRAFPVDALGKPGPPTVVEDRGEAHHDLDLVPEAEGDAFVLAYTRTRLLEPQLFSARLAPDASVLTAPRRLAPPRGPQALWGVWSAASGSFVAWQNVVQDPSQLRLSRLQEGVVEGRAVSFDHAPSATDPTIPTFATHDAGLAVLTESCVDAACEQPHWPTLVKLGPNVELQSATPLTAGGEPLDAAWDLTCHAEQCFALAAQYTQPPRVFVQREAPPSDSLPPRLDDHAGATAPARLRSIQALVEREPLAAIAAARTPSGMLLASLSDFDPNIPYERPATPAPDGRLAPLRAQLHVQYLPQRDEPFLDGSDFDQPELISLRARSIAGVDLATHAGRALLAWTAIDGGQPQLFLTVLSERGRRQRQSMLTRQSGEILSLRAAPQSSGWVIAWIDDRHGSPQLHATRVNQALRRLNPDTPLGSAEGAATGLDLHASAHDLSILSSHSAPARDAQHQVVLSRLHERTLEPLEPSLVLDEGTARLAHPRLAQAGDSTLLASWLQLGDDETRLRWRRLASDGSVQGTLQEVALSGEGSSLRVACAAQCVALVNLRRAGDAQLQLVALDAPNALERPIRLQALRAVGVAPALLDTQVFFFDAREGGSAIHRALLTR